MKVIDEQLKNDIFKFLFKDKELISYQDCNTLFNFVLKGKDGILTCCSYSKNSILKLLFQERKIMLKIDEINNLKIMQNNIKNLNSYIEANFDKKNNITLNNNILTIDIVGGLNDLQIEKIQDRFNWIDGLEFNDYKCVVFSLNI